MPLRNRLRLQGLDDHVQGVETVTGHACSVWPDRKCRDARDHPGEAAAFSQWSIGVAREIVHGSAQLD
jgi:hypothetical protein